MASWRSGTQRQYGVYIRKWKKFCSQRKVNYLRASVGLGLDFLAELFEGGLSYSTINTARSALSTVVVCNHGTFGTHPHVIRLMKGIYNQRPPLSRYSTTWDVNTVLIFLRTLSPVKDLSFKDLCGKLAMLMALVTVQRVQTLQLLDLRYMTKSMFGYTFTLSKVIKQSRAGKTPPVIELRAYPIDRRLCVVTVLREYLKRREIKAPRKENKLFIAHVRPHEGVSRDTISRWIKNIMVRAGIDTETFKAHSTRAAAASKAKAMDIPIADIMQTAGWSRASTFGKFYKKPVETRRVAHAVLQM
jgi:integrase